MRCANPQCGVIAEDLLKGTLTLIEFETPADERILHAAGGFPVCSAQTRYFWLCEACSRMFRIRKWNSSGLVLEPLWRGFTSDADLQNERKPVSPVSPASRTQPAKFNRIM